jgi:hypothetical protein
MLLGWGDRYNKVNNDVALFPEYNYDRLGQRFFVRTAFAFLAATGAFAFLAALVAIKLGHVSDAYTQALSVVISSIAAYHYLEIAKVRMGEVSVSSELEVDALRHGDWVVTMPLLTLKFYAVIDRHQFSYDSIFESPEIAAVASVLMIVLGSFVRLGLDELSGWRRLSATARIVGMCCWVFSCICLVLLLVDIGRAAATHKDHYLLLSFLFVWVGYPIVAFVSSVWRHLDEPDTPYDRRLSMVKDAAFSCLDMYAKGVFAWYSASKVFGIGIVVF